MDPGTLVGMALAFGAVFGSMIMEGDNPAAIILPPAMVLVFVGTFGVAMACGLMKDATGALAALKTALMGKKHSAETTVATTAAPACAIGVSWVTRSTSTTASSRRSCGVAIPTGVIRMAAPLVVPLAPATDGS